MLEVQRSPGVLKKGIQKKKKGGKTFQVSSKFYNPGQQDYTATALLPQNTAF